MPFLNTDVNCKVTLMLPPATHTQIMKKAQAKEIPRSLMLLVFLTHKKLMPWSLCDPLTRFLSPSLGIQIES